MAGQMPARPLRKTSSIVAPGVSELVELHPAGRLEAGLHDVLGSRSKPRLSHCAAHRLAHPTPICSHRVACEFVIT